MAYRLECKSTSHYSHSETCTEIHVLKSLINHDDAEEVILYFLLKVSEDIYFCLICQKKYVLQALLENVLP